jgi:hypothetical protein
VERVNAAYVILQKNTPAPEVAHALSRRFKVSRRQAYRYMEEASRLTGILKSPEPKGVFTVKLPVSLIGRLRTHPRPPGESLSDFAARALSGALSQRNGDG